ncbi:hypothetical protein B0T18DRAFT_330872 [Schizothecium vesticola]|uniref:MINDY deubiquitinase domain-containing protein n=1 Tax=Schizothecium vesticola TaxID=314040 RepID=A0AA40JZH6_9PEZI|nr:hypothetical protein B0T18DRAFT_330872 [Schizothecium vesticola]
MVARKPLPENATIDPQTQARMQGGRQSSDSQDIWGDEGQQQYQPQHTAPNTGTDGVPASLRPGSATNYTSVEDDDPWFDAAPRDRLTPDVNRVPTVLRPGAGGARTPSPAGSWGGASVTGDGNDHSPVPTSLRPGAGRMETNPFKRMMEVPQSEITYPSSIPAVPTAAVSQLSLGDAESSQNPWQPGVDVRSTMPNPGPLPTKGQELGDHVWDSARPSGRATSAAAPHSPVLVSMPSDEGSAGWDDVQPQKISPPTPKIPTPNQEVLEDAHAWDDLGNVDKGKAPAIPSLPTVTSGAVDDWNLIDIEGPPEPPPKLASAGKSVDTTQGSPKGKSVAVERTGDGAPPELPPRRSVEAPPRQPPRPVDKSETYQIKKINWYDPSAQQNPRISPILVQNANGPCPLVALVNALSLTTPASKPNTALIDTLRSREQVSLGLLLDAVLDELMSERWGNSGVDLPDIGELYEFLKGLHTGMNVNPRFIPTPDVVTAFKRTSLTHLHPTERGDDIPGTFEHTKEMALYSVFSIPLIHGWVPGREDAVSASFSRQATSYEDVQNLLFREEELEDKLSNSTHAGLTEEEQQIYQDILTIKSFLSISATQLTKMGLEVIRKSMRPGSFAILFRNDHFSTLFKHPQTQELLTLVTDAGYANHAEVVWESLVDVNGERAEFFSGDFRLVGGASHTESHHQQSGSAQQSSTSHGASNDGWTTADQAQSHRPSDPREPSHPPSTEQEDRDLALALQLQEEEDERHRAQQDRRRRESLLSEQYIIEQGGSAAGRGSNPSANRGGGGANHQRIPSGRGGGGMNPSQTSLLNPQRPPTLPVRHSSGAVNIPVITTTNATRGGVAATGRGGTTTGVRPPGQTVRSMIPPAAPRNPEDGVDDAPPTYEQAAQQVPYEPPTGHPSHPQSAPSVGSTAGSARASTSTSASGRPPVAVVQSPSPMINGAGRGMPYQGPYQGPYPGQQQQQQGRLRPGVPPAQMVAGNSRDRDCVVM